MAESFREAEHTGWMDRAESYDSRFTPITNQAIPHILTVLGDLSGRSVLDVCAGPGHLAAAATRRGAAAEGVDFARTMVTRARENYPEIPFQEGDAEHLPYPDQTFDHVVCAFGIMHLEQPEQAIAEAHRILRSGGRYAFTQWALDDELLRIVTGAVAAHGSHDVDVPPSPPLMRFSDPQECGRALRRAGFQDIRLQRIALAWRTDHAEAVLDLIYHGAVRAALLLDAQQPERRARIHQAIIEAAEARRSGEAIVIRRPVVLATAAKPATTTGPAA